MYTPAQATMQSFFFIPTLYYTGEASWLSERSNKINIAFFPCLKLKQITEVMLHHNRC